MYCVKKDIIDIGTETASYKVLPLGRNVYIMDSRPTSLLICPSAPLIPCLLLTTDVERTDFS